MSYINDALRKAQRERDGRYERFGGIIATGPETPRQPRKRRLVIGAAFALVVLISAGLLLAVYVLQQPSPMKRAGLPPAAADNPAPINSAIPEAASGTASERQVPPGAEPGGPRAEKALPGDETPGVVKPGEKRATSAPPGGGASALHEAEVRYTEALAAQRRGDVPGADALYQRVLALDPDHVRALNNLGVIRMEQKKREAAIALFSKAIIVKKEYVDPYYNLACLYARANDIDESLWYLKVAVAINGDVKNWAEKDADMKNIVASPAFKKIREGQKN